MRTHPIQLYREAKKLTQQELAGLLGCSQTLIALVEAGKRTVSKANAERWETVMGIPRLTLMFPTEYPVATPEPMPDGAVTATPAADIVAGSTNG